MTKTFFEHPPLHHSYILRLQDYRKQQQIPRNQSTCTHRKTFLTSSAVHHKQESSTSSRGRYIHWIQKADRQDSTTTFSSSFATPCMSFSSVRDKWDLDLTTLYLSHISSICTSKHLVNSCFLLTAHRALSLTHMQIPPPLSPLS